ncbi:Glutathione S-transferase 2 [Cladophialophora chaetospira]|uniref:Glutathione S-transferase 2 n=1 Tax=Cladophialophora chaetospira TaxID=386627 RepID=A0AA38X3Z1_9EURO|nr:Glutathione S-transferase 2 [Cladophialophora chaetospira]
MTDTFTDDKAIRLFESGAIQKYLVERYDTEYKISYVPGTREYHEMNCWLLFLNAGVGPMQGQATHFRLYAPEKLEYPKFRYHTECLRLYRILNEHLQSSSSGYLVGDHCSIADIAHYGWIACSAWSGIDIGEFPHLKEWRKRMETRSAIQKARAVPDPWPFEDLPKDDGATAQFTKPGRDWFLKVIEQDMNGQ